LRPKLTRLASLRESTEAWNAPLNRIFLRAIDGQIILSSILGLKEIFIPQDKIFFELLEKESQNVLQAALALKELVDNFTDVPLKRDRLKEWEHKGDEIVHEIYQRLNKSFITPIDHEDISKLASSYDDVLDCIYATGNMLELYNIGQPTVVMKQFVDITVSSVQELDKAFALMKKMSRDIDDLCTEVDRLENVADVLLNESVAELFKGKDIFSLIKLKEIYEQMEGTTDRCEDVGYVLRDIVMKNT
jgi:predicted phosphate transport protein (TIGR00153 family)